MSNLNATYLTHAGAAEEALAKQEGRKVQIVKVVVGTGQLAAELDPREQTALISQIAETVVFTHIGKVAGEFKVDGDLVIPDVGYNYWEIGLITDTGVLYTYTRAIGDYVPGKDDSVSKVTRPRLYFKTQNADVVTITEDKTLQYVITPDFEAHLAQYQAYALETDAAMSKRELIDNAATNADIDNGANTTKHVKLPQFWRGLIKITSELKAENNPFSQYWHNDETASKSEAELGTDNGKVMSALRSMQQLKSRISNSLTGTRTDFSASESSVKTVYEMGIEALEKAAHGAPVGVPLPWPKSTPPVGFIECRGQAFNKAIYPELAKAYPNGVLKDLRGEFIRGWANDRGVDTGRQIGNSQLDQIQNIKGTMSYSPAMSPYLSGAFYAGGFNNSGDIVRDNNNGRHAMFDASRVVRAGSETRPRNIAFMYIVRAA